MISPRYSTICVWEYYISNYSLTEFGHYHQLIMTHDVCSIREPSMSNIGQIARNTITGWGAILVQSVIALMMVPFLIGAMGKESFGLIGLFSVFIGFSNVADLGLRSALGRELAEKVANADQHGYRELAVTALALYMSLAAVLGSLVFLFSPDLIDLFKVSDALRSEAIHLLRVYGCVTVSTSFLLPVFSSGLTSFMRFDVANIIKVLVTVSTNIIVLVLVYFNRENALRIWVYTMSVSAIISLLVFYSAYRAHCFGGVLNPGLINPRHLGPLFALGWKMYLIQLSRTLSDKAHPMIISSFLGPAAVAVYHAAAKLTMMFTPMVMTLSGQLYPLTTQYHSTGDTRNMETVLKLGTRYTLLLGGLVSAGVLVFAEPFAKLWLEGAMGEDYLLAARLMRVFAVMGLLTYATGTQWPILLGMKRLRLLTALSISAALLSVSLSVYFVGFTAIGVIGVLYGAIISRFIRLLILNVYMAGLVGMNIFTYYRSLYWGPVVCMALAILVGWLTRRILPCDTWLGLVIASGITIAGWVAAALVFGVSRQEIASWRKR